MKYFFAFILLLSMSFSLSAEKIPEKKNNHNNQTEKSGKDEMDNRKYDQRYYIKKHGIGIAWGFTYGYGLSYRYWSNKYGFSITLLPLIDTKDKREEISVGLAGMKTLYQNKNLRLFIYTGVHYNRLRNELTDLSFFRQDGDYIIIGIGPGILFNTRNHFTCDFMAGFQVYKQGKNYGTYFTVETSFYFLFE